MNIKENFKNLMEKARGMNRKQLSTWRYTLIFLICVDIFGIFWFLKQRKLGIALITVFMIGLGFIMYLESKLPPEEKKEDPKTQLNNKKEVKKMPEEENTVGNGEQEEESGFDFGLPSSEEYNKRMSDAFEFRGI